MSANKHLIVLIIRYQNKCSMGEGALRLDEEYAQNTSMSFFCCCCVS